MQLRVLPGSCYVSELVASLAPTNWVIRSSETSSLRPTNRPLSPGNDADAHRRKRVQNETELPKSEEITHCTASSAPVCDAELSSSGVFDPAVASDAWFAARICENQALDALEAQITRLWGHINAATAQFMALVAEFDRKEGWAQQGVSSYAHWLSWQCGIGPVAAREKVRTARALESLPKIAEAFGEGRLSYSKVRALTRVATAATEDTLLHIALHVTAAHVERTVRGFRRVQRDLERNEAEAVHERRYLDYRRESDGSVRLDARLAPEVGELLLKALESAHAQLEERGGDAESAGVVAANAIPESVSAETPVQPTAPGGWRRSTRRAA